MSERIVYVYGIVAASAPVESAPRGLDDAPVTLVTEGALAALASQLDAATYAGGVAEARAGEVGWIGPRAVAHDAVLTWASDAGGVVPFPMFTLFSDAGAVRAMLRERSESLAAMLGRVAPAQEFGVRLFRDDAAAAAALAERSPSVAELERQARSAAPGQRYLLQRKLEGERRAELRRLGGEEASRLFDLLSPLALEGAREAVAAPAEAGAGTAVLDASFLVPRDGVEAFRETLGDAAADLERRGFRVEFTGPWPPYHFVRERAS